MKIQTFDYSVDILKALLWQYNKAQRLQTLLEKKSEWYAVNQTEFWESWYRDVFNLVTANEFGLSVWSRILEIPVFVGPEPDPEDKPIWGFDEFNENFDNGNFANDSGVSDLTVEEKRILLRLRYYQLVSRCAIPEINESLQNVFANLGSVYLLDGLNQTIRLVFNFHPSENLLDAIIRYDVIPRGAGVLLEYVDTTLPSFGFDEFNENFDNGNFQEIFST